MHPELGPYSKVLTKEQRGASFTLLESVFPQGSQSDSDYKSVISERDTKGFSLFNPLPEMFRERVFSYASVFYDNDQHRLMLKDHLGSYSRAETAELLVSTMSEHRGISPYEEAIEVIAQGMDLFKDVTGFDTDIVPDSDLANLLPRSPFPKNVDFVYYLLEIRKDFLDSHAKGHGIIQYGISNNSVIHNTTKTRLLRHGLALAEKKNVVSQVGDAQVMTQATKRGFSADEVISAFQALCGYSLNQDLAREDPQF